jgi:hypothetical protein
MCLLISLDQEENERDLKKWFGNRTKFTYVYKVLKKQQNEDFYRSWFHNGFIWDFRKGKVFQVNRDSEPTEEELTNREINKGLHVYTGLEKAKRSKGFFSTIVKFRVEKKDIVAVENYYDNPEYNFKEAVCRKLTFVKVIED